MKTDTILTYDGSFNGFLTAVYHAYDTRTPVSGFQKEGDFQKILFAGPVIQTNYEIARRVWSVIEQKSPLALKTIYFAFLSERPATEGLIFHYIRHLFGSLPCPDSDIYPVLNKLSLLSDMVAREKQKYEAQIKFKTAADGLNFDVISPGYNLLPLISRYFRQASPGKEWLVIDSKRNYGIYCDGSQVRFVRVELETREMARKDLLASYCLRECISPLQPVSRRSTHSQHLTAGMTG